jgi:hypothetical protein
MLSFARLLLLCNTIQKPSRQTGQNFGKLDDARLVPQTRTKVMRRLAALSLGRRPLLFLSKTSYKVCDNQVSVESCLHTFYPGFSAGDLMILLDRGMSQVRSRV